VCLKNVESFFSFCMLHERMGFGATICDSSETKPLDSSDLK
jgi:hypothetical protein